jgi:hypothetical protein
MPKYLVATGLHLTVGIVDGEFLRDHDQFFSVGKLYDWPQPVSLLQMCISLLVSFWFRNFEMLINRVEGSRETDDLADRTID